MRRLKIAASVLENVPDHKKDWHPGSNGQVLDLVHPSLYCVVYSRTHAYLPGKPRTAENFLPVLQTPKLKASKFEASEDGWISEKFSPSDFTVADDLYPSIKGNSFSPLTAARFSGLAALCTSRQNR